MWAAEVLVSRWTAAVRLAERQSRLFDVLDDVHGCWSTGEHPHQLQRFSGYYPYYERACKALCIRIDHSDYDNYRR